jgi:hypothetical protein
MTTVVAIVPAKDRADSVAATVRALRALDAVDRVVVVDDGSTDATAVLAQGAGAHVVRLPVNRGKGGAVLEAVARCPDADVFLLIDADLATTAGAADLLLAPVLDGDADLTIGVLPPAGGRGGFGKVRDLAARGIRRACGLEVRAPLSGQRAVRADLLRDLVDAERFGLEVAMTIDAQRKGARVLEVDVPMDHRHTGRSLAGFRHRAGQGMDILRSLWPRVTSPRQRIGLVLVGLLVAVLASSALALDARPTSDFESGRAERVVLFGFPRIGLEDLSSGDAPNLARLAQEGAVSAMSVRTLRSTPGSADAYATLSAGTRVEASPQTALAVDAESAVEGSLAREVTQRRTGRPAPGEVVVIGAAATIRGAGHDVSSDPGALGDALARADRRTGVVGSADMATLEGLPVLRRPAAVGAMTSEGSVDLGSVDDTVLEADPSAPLGLRVDETAFVREAARAIRGADFTVLDPGELDRAYAYGSASSREQYDQLRRAALRRTDELLGAVVEDLPAGTMLLVVAVTPPSRTWELTPMVAYGAGVHQGRLVSPSTQRSNLVTLTDVSATVLEALDVERPDGMIGRPLEYRSGPLDLSRLEAMNDVAVGRERVYFPVAITFIVMQALVYLAAILVLSLSGQTPTRFLHGLRFVVVAFAAWPVATFLVRIVPDLMTLGAVTHVLIWAVAVGLAALAVRRSGHPLAPLQLLAVLTVAVLLVDVSTGAHLMQSSILGYSPHTSNRFSGFGNTAYAVLAPCALIAAVLHVDRSPRRREALLGAAALLVLVIAIDGAPWLGSDVGGILSLVPVSALLLAHLSGRRIGARAVVLAGVATLAVLAVAIGVDLLRSPSDQTHIANAVDGSNLVETLSRRWSANVRIFGKSVWTWMVPIIAVLGVYVLVINRGWRRLLPAGSPLRAGVMGLFAASVLGWLVNDSGVVVTALFLVFIGPYLTLIVIADRFGGPRLLEPDPTGEEPPAGTAPAVGVQAG